MHKLLTRLSVLLVLQVMLVLGIFIYSQSARSNIESKSLLTFDTSKLSKVVLESMDDKVALRKNGSNWEIVEPYVLPIDSSKVDPLLEKLGSIEVGWPVTTSSRSHERFEVDTNTFQRKIQVYEEDKLVNGLYLGSSPGFKKAHARLKDENDVYDPALNVYDFPTRANDWLSKKLLALEECSLIKSSDYELTKSDEQWKFSSSDNVLPLPEINTENVDKLVEAITSLRVTGIATETPDFTAEDTVALNVKGQEDYIYQFLKEDNSYWVTRNDYDLSFTLTSTEYAKIADIKLSNLTIETVEEVPENETAPPAETSPPVDE
jgi:hypothetical protein